MATVEAQEPARVGTVDLVLGIIAAASLKLRQLGAETPYIPLRTLCNKLHQLQTNPVYERDLAYLDFDRIGDNWVSKGLNDILFQSGTWGLHQVPNPSLPTISVERSRAERRIRAIDEEYGVTARLRVEAMASELVSGIGGA